MKFFPKRILADLEVSLIQLIAILTFNSQVTSAFLSGRDAFTAQEVATDREVAKSHVGVRSSY